MDVTHCPREVSLKGRNMSKRYLKRLVVAAVATAFFATLSLVERPALGQSGVAEPAAAPGRGAGKGAKGKGGEAAVHTLSPGPDLGYSYDTNPLPLPAGMKYADSVASVAINSKGHIFVYQRSLAGSPMLLEFDQNQKYIRGWGDSIAVRPHGMRIDAQDNIWIADVTGNTVMKLNPQGEVVMTIGTKGKAGTWDDAACKCLDQPTDMAFAPNGNIYISQGHGGNDPRVLEFDKNGKLITQWSGHTEGEAAFHEIHTIARNPVNGNIYLADRSAKRMVIYDGNGKFVKTIQLANLPCGFYVARNNDFWMTSGQDGQIEKLDWDGKVLGWTGKGPGKEVGQFGESHYMAMDSKGDLYVADTVNGSVTKLSKKN
jgi:DNA-binding beta-propeller fold protein YncE